MTKCPLCNKDNHCAINEGKKAETCWCMKVSISKELLQSIGHRNQCICYECLEGDRNIIVKDEGK
ncbi:cysteine-rich CWC family protein [Bacillus spongiae]|uniref:cysteine-rich CWC family protein n=1 Tax=Bacillus spongiae TaxID=2683610 RepID=UPI003AF52C38